MKALQRYGFNASEFATHRSRVQAANLMHLHHRHTGVQRVCRECEVTCKRADQLHVNRRVSTNPTANIEFSCNRSTKHRASSINLQQYRLTAFFTIAALYLLVTSQRLINSLAVLSFDCYLRIFIPAKAFARDYVITGVRLSVCLLPR